MNHLLTVGELIDQLINLPRNKPVWVGVPNGGGFKPCLCIRNVNADPKDKFGDCGIILDPELPYSNMTH